MLRHLFFALAFAGAFAHVRGCHHKFRASSPVKAVQTAPIPTATPAVPARADDHVVLQWNDEAMAAINATEPRPTVAVRELFILHASIYDAWAMHDRKARPVALDASLRRDAAGMTAAAKREAVNFAAWRALVLMFPQREAKFTALLRKQGYDPAASRDTSTPSGLGRAAAERMIASRADDGANAAGNYADTTGYVSANSDDPSAGNYPGKPGFYPNRWQPLRVPTGAVRDAAGNPIVDDRNPASYRVQRFMTPQWGRVRPFALARGSQFRPEAPPHLDSRTPPIDTVGISSPGEEAWIREFEEVLTTNARLTDAQKVSAEFWATHGNWNTMARDVAMRDSKGLDDDVKLMFAVNGALLDASIACWDAKLTYDFIRPVSAIRHLYSGQKIRGWGGPNRGTVVMPGERWLPYQPLDFTTPPFPEAVSGHSSGGGAWSEVMQKYFGKDLFYDGVTTLDVDRDGDGAPDKLGEFVARPGFLKVEKGPASPVVLRWKSFTEAANDCCDSRLYGGIHISDSNRQGRDLGHLVGARAFARAKAYWEGAPSP